jgi:hypothetical protein
MVRRILVLVVLTVLSGHTACASEVEPESDAVASSDINEPNVDVATSDSTPVDWGSDDCDPIMPQRCSLPWPSNHFLVPDEKRETGVTLTFGPTTLPANRDGLHIKPEAWSRLDGYGVGTPIVMYFPNIDATDLPDENHIADSMAEDSPILLFAVKDGVLERIPCFAELEIQVAKAFGQALYIRPAVILEEGTRYIVALRNLVREDGTSFEPSPAFDALRRGDTAGTPMETRQERFDEVFAFLEADGVDTDELTLTWDFNTASGEALHGALLHVRDKAFEEVGPKGPVLTVTEVAPDEPKKPGFELFAQEDSPHIAIQLRGTMEVPHFMEEVMVPGPNQAWQFFDPIDHKPQINGVRQAEFRVRIPWSALNGEPHGVIMHGHGQTGAHDQIATDFYDEMANTENFIIIGCNMVGMASEDLPSITGTLYDMSFFHTISDRLHQGLMEHMLLVRAVRERLSDLPELADYDVKVDPDALYYSGISMGGIYGGTVMALSQDMVRGHLGVPGNNFGLIVRRSQNFHEFYAMLHIAYPDFIDKALIMGIVQSLWDQVDSVSHYRHIKESPHKNTPSHEVLLASATGDRAVALITNEIAVRSDLGIVLLPDYGKEVGMVEPTPYPHTGSGLVNYTFGNPWPPPGPIPPDDEVGNPHGLPRALPEHNEQMLHFFRTGEIIDTCGGDGCTPN